MMDESMTKNAPESMTENAPESITENAPESVCETESGSEKQLEIEDVIAELCLKTSSKAAKSCLRKYQFGKSVAQIEKDIYKEKIEFLKETAEFLKIQHFEDKTKKALSHLITCKIQNLLPDNCSVCKRRYRISLDDCPILECAICGQGVHEPCWLNLASIAKDDLNEPVDAEVFKTMVNPLNLPGMFYICDPCKVTTIPSDEEGNSKRKKRTQSTSQAQNNHRPTNNEVEDKTHTVRIDSTNDADQPYEYNTSAGKQSEDDETNKARRGEMKDNGKKSQICKFYKNGTCKHGLKGKECNYTHPKMCRNFTQHGTQHPRGCNLGIKCKDFHPKMCFDSLRKGECFSESCRFAHVKGTKRQPETVKSGVVENNKKNDKESKNDIAEPGHLLDMIRLVKVEILETLGQKIQDIQFQVQHLKQTHQIPPHQPPQHTYQIPPQQTHLIPPRPPLQIPQPPFNLMQTFQ